MFVASAVCFVLDIKPNLPTYGYYKLVPWVRQARIIMDLPSSFWHWNSRYFFTPRDGWETLFDDF